MKRVPLGQTMKLHSRIHRCNDRPATLEGVVSTLNQGRMTNPNLMQC
jgi:hypothetical protein